MVSCLTNLVHLEFDKIEKPELPLVNQNWIPDGIPTHTQFFNEAVKDPELHEGISLEQPAEPVPAEAPKSQENGTEEHNLQGKNSK